MISVETITNKTVWENFLLSSLRQPFFQSWNWGELNKRLHNHILRLGIYEGKKLIGICLVVEVQARRGRFFHLRHGPIFTDFREKYFDTFFDYVIDEAKARKVLFLRVSPLLTREEAINIFPKKGFRSAPIHNMDAEICWVLDIKKSEEILLQEMRKTTRYLIRRGEANGLKVVKAKNALDIDQFLKLYQKTAQQHGFVPHRGIKEEFLLFHKENQAELLFVKWKKKIISGALVLFYGNQAVYHHGASDRAYDSLSPSYFLQWEAIKEAKKRNKEVYNFWGIAPDDKPNHPWTGLSLFKRGFGGKKEEFVHAQDLPLKPAYWLTYTIETVRRLLKGY